MSRRMRGWTTVGFGAVLAVAVVATAMAVVPPLPFDGVADGRATVTITDEETGETLGVVRARVADEPGERYTGLSETESLANDSGMLFVYEAEDTRVFVMRRMDFPIDMVFVGANGSITTIYHAPVEEDQSSLTKYPGEAQWVLEVPYNWTVRNNVTVGDEMAVEYPANASVTPTPRDS